MKILAFETSAEACSVALFDSASANKIHIFHEVAPMQQAQMLLPQIVNLLQQARLDLNELDAIAIGQGPGSFTGIRIASSVAQGLSFATNVPILAISSLAALAQTALSVATAKYFLVAVDARMNQIYWAIYQFNPQSASVSLIGQEEVLEIADFDVAAKISTLGSQDYVAIGDGWAHLETNLLNTKIIKQPLHASASALIKLAEIKIAQGGLMAGQQAHPNYLRELT